MGSLSLLFVFYVCQTHCSFCFAALVKRNTPVSQHDNTLLFFGDNEAFRDSLRMHNIMTGYVFLIDGVGRVRFAASGPATTQELDKLVGFAEELLFVRPEAKRSVPQKGRRKYRK